MLEPQLLSQLLSQLAHVANHELWNYEPITFTTPLMTCHVLGSTGAVIWLSHPCRTLGDAMYGLWCSCMRVPMNFFFYFFIYTAVSPFSPFCWVTTHKQPFSFFDLYIALAKRTWKKKIKKENKEEDGENRRRRDWKFELWIGVNGLSHV